MQYICSKYAKNMRLHRLQHSKYAKNMQKICNKYAQYATKICNKYAFNMQNMHKSMYLHILHIYALPTLLMNDLMITGDTKFQVCPGPVNLKFKLSNLSMPGARRRQIRRRNESQRFPASTPTISRWWAQRRPGAVGAASVVCYDGEILFCTHQDIIAAQYCRKWLRLQTTILYFAKPKQK